MIISYEAAQAHAATFPSRSSDYGEFFREVLEGGSAMGAQAYAEAIALRDDYSNRFRAVLGAVDAIACPSGGTPFAIDPGVQFGGLSAIFPALTKVADRFTVPANFAGTPTISVQCGLSESGVPHTMQFMGSALTEPTLCRLALGLEQATEWHTLHPRI